jgi:hypothetical protein
MTGNISGRGRIYLDHRQQNVLKLWLISFFESSNRKKIKTFATNFTSRRLHLLYNKRISPRKSGDKLVFNRIPRKYFQRLWIVNEKWRLTYSQFHTLINVIWFCVLMSHREYKYLLTINIFWKLYCPVLQNALLKFFFKGCPLQRRLSDSVCLFYLSDLFTGVCCI